jgi:cell division GTPase FtsZ
MPHNIKDKSILIKTYLFESGLYYLAKSLGDMLSKNNKVVYTAKPKFKRLPGRPGFSPVYHRPSNPNLHAGIEVATQNAQIENIVAKNNIDLIISFETFMPKAQWITRVRTGNPNLKIIDIPMPEWSIKRYIDNNSYRMFDEIWCLTDTSAEVFGKYENAKKMSWDYVDENAFSRKVDKNTLSGIRFFHPGSTNPSFSQKNTTEVIKAYTKFSLKHGDSTTLTISGLLTESDAALAGKCKNIILINSILELKDLVDIYDNSHCVLMPSTREGLGMSLHEASAMGCEIITTNVDPMNKHSKYLCDVISYNANETPVKFAITGEYQISTQLESYYEDFMTPKAPSVKDVKIKKKTKKAKDIEIENEALMDAFEGSASVPDDPMDDSVLEALKSKMNKSKERDVPVVTSEQSVSIEIAVIGVGQAGSRIAETMHKKGYDVGVINTSAQDLEFIDVLPTQKLLLEGSLGGTGKDLDLGRQIFEESRDDIQRFVGDVTAGNHMVYLAISGGGGTGSSSVDTMVGMLFETGMPVGVIYILPKATEDAQSKRNSIETLSKLAIMTSDNMVSNLIVVDNARIEQIYSNLSQNNFWSVSNNAIIEPLHVFNTLTARPSRYTSMDPSDFGKIISCGDCSIYGMIEVEDYMEETALAEAVIESLNGNMLASGFDVSQTRVGGVIISAPEAVLNKLPAININYCFHMISEQTNGASIFQGVYDTGNDSDSVKIYSWFAGLGLPRDRIESLKQESKIQTEIADQKEKGRVAAMTLDLDEDNVNTVADQVHRKIKKKKSGFNKLQRGSIIDKRRRR